MASGRKCRIAGKPKLTKGQVAALTRLMPGERYSWCQYCKQYHRVSTPRLEDKP